LSEAGIRPEKSILNRQQHGDDGATLGHEDVVRPAGGGTTSASSSSSTAKDAWSISEKSFGAQSRMMRPGVTTRLVVMRSSFIEI
jgi:hypothetical protein